MDGVTGSGGGAEERLVADAVNRAYREEWARVLATAVRVARDFDTAEDCVQDAFARAITSWPRDGIPDRPGAWLTTVAVRQVLQVRRRAATLTRKLPLLVLPPDEPEDFDPEAPLEALPDERLRLVFTCCHPVLPPESRLALTLRLICGLTTAEVARLFLVKETAMQARITRAKRRITEAGVAYATPTGPELPERLDSVLDTVHLLYTAGHVAPVGETLLRDDLADRAISFAGMVHDLLPAESEATALLALLLLTEARRDARVSSTGALTRLQDQDRSRWDRRAAARGMDLLREAAAARPASRYVLMASIAACHTLAPTWQATPWSEIVRLYDALLVEWPSPVVALNRAVAVAELEGPEAALVELDALADAVSLSTYPYLAASRADLLRRAGRTDEAAAAYQEAILLTGNSVEAAFLAGQLELMRSGAEPGETPERA
jgi:RNA polymerase sigma-70 factor (ECF subfamily)